MPDLLHYSDALVMLNSSLLTAIEANLIAFVDRLVVARSLLASMTAAERAQLLTELSAAHAALELLATELDREAARHATRH